jgi:hypothetical protein
MSRAGTTTVPPFAVTAAAATSQSATSKYGYQRRTTSVIRASVQH